MVPEKLVVDIIKEQSLIIGENLARRRAENTGSVQFNSTKIEDISLKQNNPLETIDKLIKSYSEIFGQASVEVCIDVIKRYPISEINEYLPEVIRKQL